MLELQRRGLIRLASEVPPAVVAARTDFAAYCALTSAWAPEAWQTLICRRLQRLLGETGQRLLIHGPPQFGKSWLISQRLPGWALGVKPTWRIRLACYNVTHATRFTALNRDILQSDLYGQVFPDPAVRLPAQCAREEWSTAARSAQQDAQASMMALGIGSGFVGQGADLLIIDDPYKNRMEAFSPTIRENVWGWWQQVVLPRLNPQANVVVMFHRWHEDDLAGRLAASGTWEQMRFPALADGGPDDPTGRPVGASLSSRYPEAYLESLRDQLGSAFQSLYQGTPVADGGNMLKRVWWQYYETMPAEYDEVIQSWDMTFKESDGSDYVCGQVWGRDGARYYLLDLVNERADAVGAIRLVEMMTARWPMATLKLVEDAANGPAVVAMLRRKVPGLLLVQPEGGKLARVNAVQPVIEAGNVFLPTPEAAPWVTPFIEQCAAFPAGAHDDMVDAMSQALLRFIVNTCNWPKEGTVEDDEERQHRELLKAMGIKPPPGRNDRRGPATGW